MDTLKALLNQILLFFDDVGSRTKRLPAKGRRRVVLLVSIFLVLVLLLLILCLSSCKNTAAAATSDNMEAELRTRVRGSFDDLPSANSWVEDVRIASDVYPVYNSYETEETALPDNDMINEPKEDPDNTLPDEPEESSLDDPDEPENVSDEPEQVEETPEPVTEVESTPEPDAKYSTLKKHDKSEAVTTMQYRLMELGYLDIDEPTNYFGTSTETAIILFQRQHDLKQDGIAGNETQTILYGDSAERYCLKEGAEGQDVKALQEQLVVLGYMAEKEVDRVYGPVTVAAVEAFQKRNGLHVDGLAGEKTLELLYSDSAKMTREMQKQVEAEAAAQKKAEEAEQKKAEEEAKKKAAEEAAKKKATPTKKAKATAKAKTTVKKTPTPKPTKKPTPTPKKDTRVEKFIKAANSKLGCEYVLGAKGPNKFDCSGFVYWCLKQAGVGGTRLNALGYSRKSGWKLISSVSGLKKGDIIFFKSDTNNSVNHTGIYVGGGNMIDASSGNGKVVKRPLSAYWKRNFVCARRPWKD